ncbi:MAG TPA: hypothetical protein VKC56_05275 [Gallionellaceae bacterium]|nr:hypothetical protein [Gallionellaceae bacterium]
MVMRIADACGQTDKQNMTPYRKGLMRHHGGGLSIFHRILDVGSVFVALWACAGLYGVTLELHYKLVGMFAVVAFLVFAEWQLLYESWRAESIRNEAWTIVVVWTLTCVTLLALGFFSKSSLYFSRLTIVGWMVSTPFLLTLERVLLRKTLRHFRVLGMNSRTVAIVGSGSAVPQLVNTINASPWMGLRIEGVYDNEAWAQFQGAPKQDVAAFMQQVGEQVIDAVYICCPMMQEEKIRQLVEQLADGRVSVHVVPDVFVSDLLKARWTTLGGIPLVSVFDSSMYGANVFLKRL